MKITRISEQAVPVPYPSSRAHGIGSGLATPARPVEFRCFSLSPGDGLAVMMNYHKNSAHAITNTQREYFHNSPDENLLS